MSPSRRVGASSLAHTARSLVEQEDLASFRAELPVQMRGLVDCEIASYNEIGSGPEDVLVSADPVMPEDLGGMYDAFAALIMQNPLAVHFQRTRDERALRMSDFISTRKLHELDLYDLVYRHIATEYQLAFTVPVRGRLVGVTVSRAGRDFSDEELDRFEAARHIAVSVHRNLDDRARLDVIVRGLDEIEDGPLAVLLVEAGGRLSPAHDRAERLLSELSMDEAAVEALSAWAAVQHGHGPLAASESLILPTVKGELLARYIHGSPGNFDAVAVRLTRAPKPHSLRELGLTPRQAEVLHLLWQGSTNADIARSLSVSEHTVRHHLEDIYRQLGVSSRVAAAQVAGRALA